MTAASPITTPPAALVSPRRSASDSCAGAAGLPVNAPVTRLQPGAIYFGDGCAARLGEEIRARGLRELFVVTSAPVRAACAGVLEDLAAAGLRVRVYDGINAEPTVAMFEACLKAARAAAFDGVVGLGGGSPLDVAKLVAALADEVVPVREKFGTGRVASRGKFLACVPTTAGTGSEVSPNAILLDEATQLKQGVISPHLVPDVACVDPRLTHSLPPEVTAATALDALTHCIEGYANRFAHPLVDPLALAGIEAIAAGLPFALKDGRNAAARAQVALGSLHGGLCLGPVNTAAVHALAYPLGSEFHLAHGLSNALLLPQVLRFNLPAAPERYAAVARALGAREAETALATARRGVERIEALLAACPLPRGLAACGIPREALPRLARSAMTVTRLLKNNPRPLTEADALAIYEEAW